MVDFKISSTKEIKAKECVSNKSMDGIILRI